MRRRYRVYWLSMAVMAAVTLAKQVPALAATMVDRSQNWLLTCYNPCTEEWLLLEGATQTVMSVTTDSNGGEHFNVLTRSAARGTDTTSGITYNLQSQASSIQNLKVDPETREPAQATYTQIHRCVGVANGPNPNFVVYLLVHTDVNADGEITTRVDRADAVCMN